MFGSAAPAEARDRCCVRALVAAIGAALALYLMFERTFQVSLPHGLLGALLGF